MLFEAVHNGDLDRISNLLDSGTDVNERDDKFFNTALHRAIFAKNNRISLIDLLISRGADCNALNRKAQTPSEFALETKQHDLAKHMILRETEQLNGDDHLAYYFLIRRGNLQLFEFLITIKQLNYEHEMVVIARAYAELRLRNVPLKEHMENYLNEILINHDYWLINDDPESFGGSSTSTENVHRIRDIVENVQHLLSSYRNSNMVDVDGVFLLRLTHILENIFFIRDTDKELPLQQLEFCVENAETSGTQEQKKRGPPVPYVSNGQYRWKHAKTNAS
ncbi:uncharacterized protein LOC129748213 [Uranotaenia lowii]|uniref:uncharacterized protein LOC129748213 n=1 Tax=Uranotaenia lowii TaxID=190385 RepID=UPI0024795EBF|nr:uncharacterized protein LOC129748213 [Uranotaenia lowii]